MKILRKLCCDTKKMGRKAKAYKYDEDKMLEHEREIIQIIQREDNSEFRERAIEKVLGKR